MEQLIFDVYTLEKAIAVVLSKYFHINTKEDIYRLVEEKKITMSIKVGGMLKKTVG